MTSLHLFLLPRSKEGQARLPISVDAAGGLLRFASISQGNGGRYVCEAGNAAGTARATAEVIVQGTENSVVLLDFILHIG